ncbi:hypothetical protein [Devosia sp. A16]|uniref:hypothetical protein n=1 Tax=Devosia sp. A16 TaxID=1736675 RepID=UPI0006D7BBC0|nr:hypothetical protein [Devosia sp. A16]
MFDKLLQALRGNSHASSGDTVETRRRRLGMELWATVYCYSDRSFIVTSVITAPGEISMEVGEPTVLPIEVSDTELGAVALRHLVEMVKRRPPLRRERKLTDWRVYQVSGARSVRAFTSHSLTVSLETTPTGIGLSSRGTHVVEGMPWATATASTDATDLGASIRQVIEAAKASVA